MSAPQNDLTNMTVTGSMIDAATQETVAINLTLSQNLQTSPPLLVWGTGISPGVPGALQTNNFYYSLTRLQVQQGSITIGSETIPASGTVWMDHEWGYFGGAAEPLNWVLQDVQLSNGVTLSNYARLAPGQKLAIDQPCPSLATVQFADGTTYYLNTFVTPRKGTWISPKTKQTYYKAFQVDIPTFEASLLVTSCLSDQEFVNTLDIPLFWGLFDIPITLCEVYEGVAYATGTFLGEQVEGTAWIEQEPCMSSKL
jgi:predicted secreted hydrolase